MPEGVESIEPEICAKAILGFIKVTCYLLDQQHKRLEKDFLDNGGIRERMTRVHLDARRR